MLQLQKPSQLPKFMILIQPFSPMVWLALIASILASLIMLVLYGILQPMNDSSACELNFILMAAFLDQSQNGILRTKSNVVRLVQVRNLGTESIIKVCTKLQKICSSSWFSFMHGPAWVLLSNIYKLFYLLCN